MYVRPVPIERTLLSTARLADKIAPVIGQAVVGLGALSLGGLGLLVLASGGNDRNTFRETPFTLSTPIKSIVPAISLAPSPVFFVVGTEAEKASLLEQAHTEAHMRTLLHEPVRRVWVAVAQTDEDVATLRASVSSQQDIALGGGLGALQFVDLRGVQAVSSGESGVP